MHSDLSKFLQKIDEVWHPTFFHSPEHNYLLLTATTCLHNMNSNFDADSFPLILDIGSSSTDTPFKCHFVKGTCKQLKGVTMFGVASEFFLPLLVQSHVKIRMTILIAFI